jgi:hypothetical protein
MRRAAALLTIVLSTSACFSMKGSAEFGPRLSPDTATRIIPGETTRAELLAWLGPPEEFQRAEVSVALGDAATRVSGAVSLGNLAHDVFTWQHDRISARGRWWLLYLWTETSIDSDVLMVVFGEDDRVAAVSLREAVVE